MGLPTGDIMKSSIIFASITLLCLSSTTTVIGQKKSCELNIIGTWRVVSPDNQNHLLYRFEPDSKLTVLSRKDKSSDLREIGSASYKLDNPKAPKTISFVPLKEGDYFSGGQTTMEITGYDDRSLTCVKPGFGASRWIREDQSRYFLILAGRSGVFYDRSGPTFPMLIKFDGRKTQIDAVGIYFSGGKPYFGTVPEDARKEFINDSHRSSEVVLRLEISGTQYETVLKIMRTWERRANEGALLYPDISMDNILLVKQVTESLNQCGEKIKLYNLDWGIGDHISENNPPSLSPFFYFKELKRLNEPLHIRDEKFNEFRK
jgi:hypothetical protein